MVTDLIDENKQWKQHFVVSKYDMEASKCIMDYLSFVWIE